MIEGYGYPPGEAARSHAEAPRAMAARRVTAGALERSHALAEIRSDLESAIVRHPVRAIAIAFVAGYLTRRIF